MSYGTRYWQRIPEWNALLTERLFDAGFEVGVLLTIEPRFKNRAAKNRSVGEPV